MNTNQTPYKMLYLVGKNEAGDQVLLTFRYREVKNIPVLQLQQSRFGLDGKVQIEYSDIEVEHTDNYISGGVPSQIGKFSKSHPDFTYNRHTLELKFYFSEIPMSCVVLEDTAVPFVQLIARM